AMARSAYREAVAYFEQALGTLPHLPETRDTRERAIDLRLALRSALYPSGDFGRVLAYLREAETLAAALDDPWRLGQVANFLSVLSTRVGRHDQAFAAARRPLALATVSACMPWRPNPSASPPTRRATIVERSTASDSPWRPSGVGGATSAWAGSPRPP